MTRGQAAISLTARQFSLLELLMRHKGEVLSRTAILEHVWDFAYDGTSNVVDVYVRYLRDKVDRPFGRARHRDGARRRLPAARRRRVVGVARGHVARRVALVHADGEHGQDDRPNGNDDPRQRRPSLARDGRLAGLDEPVRRQALGDGAQHAFAERPDPMHRRAVRTAQSGLRSPGRSSPPSERWPIRIPSTAKGISPIRIRPVMVNQPDIGSRTPSEIPATYSTTMVTAAIAYPLTSFALKYVRTGSGVTRSWRCHRTDRSAAMRAPLAITARHRAPADHARHVVDGERDAVELLVPVRPGDQQEQHERERRARRRRSGRYGTHAAARSGCRRRSSS